MDLNYFGTLNSLKHFYEWNSRPLHFVMICSTIAFYTFPGYSSYAPSKSALRSLYESLNLEMEKENISLYIYYVSSIDSSGYCNENLTKPEFTKDVEGMGSKTGWSAEGRAKVLLREMGYNRVIVSDTCTNLLKIKSEASSVKEYILLPFSILFYPLWKLYVKRKFLKDEKYV
jgi:3-dehydrosphinganine reductase